MHIYINIQSSWLFRLIIVIPELASVCHQRRNEGLPRMHCISLLFTITIFNEHLAKSC